MIKKFNIFFGVLVLAVSMVVMTQMTGCDQTSCSYSVSSSVYPSGDRASAQIFYPCNIDSISGTLASTTVTGGATNTKEDMYWLAEYLRDNGDMIVVAVSASNNMTIASYEAAQKAGIGILQAENNNSSSAIHGKVGKLATMGYSMGGAGALQAAHDLGSTLGATIGLAPYSTSSTLYGIAGAAMAMVGSMDAIAPPYMAQAAFNNFPSSVPRAYAEIFGETHLFWPNNNNGSPAKELILAWLKYYLSGDSSYYSTITNPPSGITNYEFIP